MPKTLTRFESEATLYEAKMTWTVGRVRELIKRKELLDSPCFSCKSDPNNASWSVQLDFGNAQPDRLTIICTNHGLATREVFVESFSFVPSGKSGKSVDGSYFATDVTFGGATSEQSSILWITNVKLSVLSSLTEKDKALSDGNLYVTCKVKYYGSVKTHQRSGPVYKLAEPTPREKAKFDITGEVILSSLARDLAALSTDCNTADVAIVVGETRIPAHRCILAARSSVFKAMLAACVEAPYENYEPCRAQGATSTSSGSGLELKLEQKNPVVVDALIKFCYSGKIPSDLDKIAKELLVVSDFFEVKTLRDVCSDCLIKRLSLKTALDYLTVAHEHDCDQLKKASLDLVVKNAAKFMAHDEWAKFSKDHPDLLNEVCRSLALRKK